MVTLTSCGSSPKKLRSAGGGLLGISGKQSSPELFPAFFCSLSLSIESEPAGKLNLSPASFSPPPTLFPRNPSLVPKTLGTAGLEHSVILIHQGRGL